MRRILGCLVIAVALLSWGPAAEATPILWTLGGVTFDDGGTASGSFVFDADTSAYSAINIVTTAGSSSAPGTTYGSVVPAWTDLSRVGTADGPWGTSLGPNVLVLGFPNLTNAGGVVNLLTNNSGFEGVCNPISQPTTCGFTTQYRFVTAGTLSGAPVPAPSTALLLGTGLVGLATRRRHSN